MSHFKPRQDPLKLNSPVLTKISELSLEMNSRSITIFFFQIKTNKQTNTCVDIPVVEVCSRSWEAVSHVCPGLLSPVTVDYTDSQGREGFVDTFLCNRLPGRHLAYKVKR